MVIAAVIVTHDQDEAMVLGDKIVVMQGGVIHQADTPKTVWDNPSTDFVAGFVGNSNKLHGRLEKDVLHFGSANIEVSKLTASSKDRLEKAMNGDVLAFFRPDAATVICSSGANQCNELRIPIIVRDFHFMGSFVRISVELKEHAGKLVKVNMTEIAPDIQPGCEGYLAIGAEDLMVFKG